MNYRKIYDLWCELNRPGFYTIHKKANLVYKDYVYTADAFRAMIKFFRDCGDPRKHSDFDLLFEVKSV